MVEVFKTDVKTKRQAKLLLSVLARQFPFTSINFDLDDCDHILRIEGDDFCALKTIELLKLNGHACLVLE